MLVFGQFLSLIKNSKGFFLIKQIMFFDCDLEGCNKKKTDELVNFSEHLDAIWPTLWHAKHLVLKCQQSPKCFPTQAWDSLFSCFFLSELGWELFLISFLFSWSLGFSLDLESRVKFAVRLFSCERPIFLSSKVSISWLSGGSFFFHRRNCSEWLGKDKNVSLNCWWRE